MGQSNPFFERAGFRRVGVIRKSRTGSARGAYGGSGSARSAAKSRFSEPVYYVFNNRSGHTRQLTQPVRHFVQCE
jgi:hypothetical protein